MSGHEVTEKDFMRQVIDLAKIFGWWCYHPTLSKWSEKGWPDLVMLRERDGRSLFVELKANRGVVSADQHLVHARLLACGMDMRVWRPADMDEIVSVLR